MHVLVCYGRVSVGVNLAATFVTAGRPDGADRSGGGGGDPRACDDDASFEPQLVTNGKTRLARLDRRGSEATPAT